MLIDLKKIWNTLKGVEEKCPIDFTLPPPPNDLPFCLPPDAISAFAECKKNLDNIKKAIHYINSLDAYEGKEGHVNLLRFLIKDFVSKL